MKSEATVERKIPFEGSLTRAELFPALKQGVIGLTSTATKERDMPIKVSALLPGLLVHVSTSIKGNVSYYKSEETVTNENGVEISEWKTERTVIDPKEQKLATEVKSKARALVTGVCIPTEHGLLCPISKRDLLDASFDKARALVADFNRDAYTTTLKFNALAGYIAEDDASATRAITNEVRGLIEEMQAGVDGLDVERVREAAKRAKKIGNMLQPEMKASIDAAVKDVRAMATKMVEAGEQASTVIDAEVLNKLTAARTLFLDIEDAAEVAETTETAARAIDLHVAEDDDFIDAPTTAPARDLELEDMLA